MATWRYSERSLHRMWGPLPILAAAGLLLGLAPPATPSTPDGSGSAGTVLGVYGPEHPGPTSAELPPADEFVYPDGLLDYINELQDLASTGDPETFAGVWTDGPFIAELYVTVGHSLTPAAQRLLDEATAHDVTVTVKTQERSYRELQEALDALPKSQAFQKIPSDEIARWGIDERNNWIELGVADPNSPAVRQYLQSAPEIVHVVKRPVLEPASRQADTSPFYGGDKIFRQVTSSSTTFCTGGFGIKNASNVTYMLTAGHCGNGAWKTPNASVPAGTTMGTTAFNAWNATAKLDAQLIPTGTAGRVFLGGISSTTSGAIKGQNNLCNGCPAIFSGATSGQRSGTQSGGNNFCGNINGVSVCHLVNASGSPAPCDHGDSGGPVIVAVTGGYNAIGTMSGTAPPNCSFTMLSAVLTYYTSSIQTG